MDVRNETTLLGFDLLIGTPKLFWVFQSNVATIHTLSERRLEH